MRGSSPARAGPWRRQAILLLSLVMCASRAGATNCTNSTQCATNACLGGSCCLADNAAEVCTACNATGACTTCRPGAYVPWNSTCVGTNLWPGRSCQEDFQCAYNWCLDGKCTESRCATDSDCMYACRAGFCCSDPGAGGCAACDAWGRCMNCTDPDKVVLGGGCGYPRRPGYSCSANDACRSGNCTNGACRAPLCDVDAQCSATGTCGAPFCCNIQGDPCEECNSLGSCVRCPAGTFLFDTGTPTGSYCKHKQAGGASCTAPDQCESNQCVAGSCGAVLSAGAACTVGGTPCAGGAECQGGVCCRAPNTYGWTAHCAACGDYGYCTQCTPPFSLGTASTPSSCGALGAACASDSACMPGLLCDPGRGVCSTCTDSDASACSPGQRCLNGGCCDAPDVIGPLCSACSVSSASYCVTCPTEFMSANDQICVARAGRPCQNGKINQCAGNGTCFGGACCPAGADLSPRCLRCAEAGCGECETGYAPWGADCLPLGFIATAVAGVLVLPFAAWTCLSTHAPTSKSTRGGGAGRGSGRRSLFAAVKHAVTQHVLPLVAVVSSVASIAGDLFTAAQYVGLRSVFFTTCAASVLLCTAAAQLVVTRMGTRLLPRRWPAGLKVVAAPFVVLAVLLVPTIVLAQRPHGDPGVDDDHDDAPASAQARAGTDKGTRKGRKSTQGMQQGGNTKRRASGAVVAAPGGGGGESDVNKLVRLPEPDMPGDKTAPRWHTSLVGSVAGLSNQVHIVDTFTRVLPLLYVKIIFLAYSSVQKPSDLTLASTFLSVAQVVPVLRKALFLPRSRALYAGLALLAMADGLQQVSLLSTLATAVAQILDGQAGSEAVYEDTANEIYVALWFLRATLLFVAVLVAAFFLFWAVFVHSRPCAPRRVRGRKVWAGTAVEQPTYLLAAVLLTAATAPLSLTATCSCWLPLAIGVSCWYEAAPDANPGWERMRNAFRTPGPVFAFVLLQLPFTGVVPAFLLIAQLDFFPFGARSAIVEQMGPLQYAVGISYALCVVFGFALTVAGTTITYGKRCARRRATPARQRATTHVINPLQQVEMGTRAPPSAK